MAPSHCSNHFRSGAYSIGYAARAVLSHPLPLGDPSRLDRETACTASPREKFFGPSATLPLYGLGWNRREWRPGPLGGLHRVAGVPRLPLCSEQPQPQAFR